MGHVQAKKIDYIPWSNLCMDLIKLYVIHIKGTHKNSRKEKDLTLWCVTMIDTTSNWFKMAEIKS